MLSGNMEQECFQKYFVLAITLVSLFLILYGELADNQTNSFYGHFYNNYLFTSYNFILSVIYFTYVIMVTKNCEQFDLTLVCQFSKLPITQNLKLQKMYTNRQLRIFVATLKFHFRFFSNYILLREGSVESFANDKMHVPLC